MSLPSYGIIALSINARTRHDNLQRTLDSDDYDFDAAGPLATPRGLPKTLD